MKRNKVTALKLQFGFVFLLILTACRPNTASIETLPTLVQLPTTVAQAVDIPTATEEQRVGPPTLPPTFTPEPTQTSAATNTHIPTSAVSSTPYQDLMIPIEDYTEEDFEYFAGEVGDFSLEVGGDFSNPEGDFAYGYYIAEAISGVSEITWSTTLESADGAAYPSYIRICYPRSLAPGTYDLESELESSPRETVTVLFWYDHENYGQMIFAQRVSGSISFSATGSEVSATFDYTGSRGEETITFEGSVEGARPE
jgi:hypothetical protein